MSQGGSRIGAMIVANLRASPAKSAVLGAGCIVLVVLLVRMVAGGPKSATAEPAAELLPQPGTASAAMAAALAPAREPRLPRPRVRQTLARDPFSPAWLGTFAPVGDEEAGELALQMVMTADGGSSNAVAVISGVMVYPGTWVGGFEVVAIANGRVTLRNGTETIQLRMP